MNYGQPYGATPSYGDPGYGYAQQRGLAALAPQGYMGLGAEGDTPTGTGTGDTGTMATVKTWLDTPTVGVQRKYLLGGALALTGIYYAYSQGWFDGGKAKARRSRR